MRLPRVRFRIWWLMVAAAVAGVGSGIATRWPRPTLVEERWGPAGPLMRIAPPDAARYADPYRPDAAP
jgi:hypothetical protein